MKLVTPIATLLYVSRYKALVPKKGTCKVVTIKKCLLKNKMQGPRMGVAHTRISLQRQEHVKNDSCNIFFFFFGILSLLSKRFSYRSRKNKTTIFRYLRKKNRLMLIAIAAIAVPTAVPG